MQDGWFIILLLFGGLTFAGTLLVFWLARATASQRDADALSASDLRLLEESVEALISRLKAASDEAVAEIDRRQRALQALLDRVDARLGDSTPVLGEERRCARDDARADATDAGEGVRLRDVCRMAGEGFDGEEIARRSGLTRGEVELILEVQAARR